MLVKNLSFSFSEKKIFSGVEMEFPVGLITGIVGKNGVGKTTFFRVLKGIYPPSSGNVRLDGQLLKGSQISFLPTRPYFYPYMKGKEYLELVLGTAQHNNELAKLYDLPLDGLVRNYSTGMKKKLAFAGIMGLEKRVQILDEPFSGVDLQSNITISQILKMEKADKITIVSSHMLDSMLTLCDRIYFIREGFEYSLYEREGYGQLEQELGQAVEAKLRSYRDSRED